MFGLEISNVTKAFGAHVAVDDVSMSIPQGELVCFLGPSGCGKTTLMRMVAGLESPGEGAIARALAQEPPVFLLDEPFSALDAKLREEMQIELRLLQKRLKITTILMTHDQREAMSMADSIAVMGDGKIQQYGSPLSIYRAPANRFVANFVGLSNLLPVEVLDADTVRFGANILKVAPMPAPTLSTQATLSIRPEDIQLTAANAAGDNTVSGRITFIRDMGSSVEVHLDCDGRDVLSVVQPRDWIGAGTGDVAHLRLPQNQCRVLAA